MSNLPSSRKKILRDWANQLSEWLCKLSNLKWWITALAVFIVLAVIGYWVFLFVVDADILTKIKQFPDALQEHLSIENWWLERLLELTVPMFLTIALSIQLARLSEDDAEMLKRLVPWLPGIRNIFAVKIPMFFVATAAVFSGMVTLLVIGGPKIDTRPLILFPISIGMLITAITMKSILSKDPRKGPLGNWIMNNHKWITLGLVIISLIFWLIANWVLPILARIDLYELGITLAE